MTHSNSLSQIEYPTTNLWVGILVLVSATIFVNEIGKIYSGCHGLVDFRDFLHCFCSNCKCYIAFSQILDPSMSVLSSMIIMWALSLIFRMWTNGFSQHFSKEKSRGQMFASTDKESVFGIIVWCTKVVEINNHISKFIWKAMHLELRLERKTIKP